MAKDLTVGKPFKVILTFALPMIIGNIFQQLYNIVDTAVVGQFVSNDALAGVGSTASMVFLIVQVAMGASIGCSVVISQLYGSKRLKDTKTATYTTLITMGVMGILFSAIGLIFIDGILVMLSTPADIYDIAREYLQIYLYGCFPMLLYNGISSAFQALGESKLPLYFLIMSSVLNVALDLVFVLSFGMGVAGVAWATFIAQTLACLLSMFVLIRRMRKMYTEERAKAFDKTIFKKIVTIGLPSMLQQAVISIGHICVQSLVNSYGAAVIAGFTAANKVEQVLTSTFTNIANALSSYTAQNIGCHKIDRIKAGYRTTFYMIAVLSVIMLLLSVFIPDSLISIFVDSTASAEEILVGRQYLSIVGCTYLICGLMVISNGVLRGAGDVKIVVICSLCNIAIRVGGAYLFSGVWGSAAIWWAVPMGWLVGAAISTVRYFTGKWQSKSIF